MANIWSQRLLLYIASVFFAVGDFGSQPDTRCYPHTSYIYIYIYTGHGTLWCGGALSRQDVSRLHTTNDMYILTAVKGRGLLCQMAQQEQPCATNWPANTMQSELFLVLDRLISYILP